MEKERGLIGMESDSIRSAETLAQSELTRIRVMRAERWARSDKLMAAEAGRYSGMLDQVGVTAAAAAMREKSAKVRMEAIESLRADSIRSFAVEVDARAQSGRMWVEEQKLDQGEKREPVPVPIINAIKDARVGLAEINDLAAAQEKLGAWSLVSQYVVGTYGISYDDFVTASAMPSGWNLDWKLPNSRHWVTASTVASAVLGHSTVRHGFVVGSVGFASFAAVQMSTAPSNASNGVGGMWVIPPRVAPKFGSESRRGRASVTIVGMS